MRGQRNSRRCMVRRSQRTPIFCGRLGIRCFASTTTKPYSEWQVLVWAKPPLIDVSCSAYKKSSCTCLARSRPTMSLRGGPDGTSDLSQKIEPTLDAALQDSTNGCKSLTRPNDSTQSWSLYSFPTALPPGSTRAVPWNPCQKLQHLRLRQQHAPVSLCAGAAPLALRAAHLAEVRVLLPAVLAHLLHHLAPPTAF